MACQHVLAQRRIVDPKRAAFAHVDLAGTPHSAPLGRIFLRENLRRRVPTEVLQTAELLTTELIANVVLQAGTSLHLGIACDDARLLVTVHHHDLRDAARRHQTTVMRHGEAGRRTALVESLADDSGSSRLPDGGGRVTWFVLGLKPHTRRHAAAATDTTAASSGTA